eukprot:9249116-Lingulodinium_polyedra.AAC.1
MRCCALRRASTPLTGGTPICGSGSGRARGSARSERGGLQDTSGRKSTSGGAFRRRAGSETSRLIGRPRGAPGLA